ncbi:acetyltransferase-like isoleucine patch superfamily enzyme [Kitasatospora sp. MAA4]|uniref:acyltransferase n=1 Tax=Kitasatospora sp. MAA4 TaxID=3035093 RepID=UPI002473D8FF|nr:hypothetical protein [Kitasatospora sp. MAA4]MDH6131368.1 acetyltransferase-like isoleucine patch superfamily enzyme [Kitasatospora sp. MAA4]
MSKSDYFDPNTTVERVDVADLAARLAQPSAVDPYPIVRYAQTLKELRKKSSSIGNEQQQMEFGQLVKASLAGLAAELGLPGDHFSVDTSGDPLLVSEGTGQHWIMPTNFESGAYFSAPHADHHYALEAEQIPRIRIGKYTRFGKGSGINAGGDITIGDGAWMSPGSLLLRQDHAAYGRPSIASRTVSMTRQPAVVLRDFAWVGRDALVGWNSDYLGLASIVGTRSFINGWVGDYSIVGDHDRILQYQPFKAFLLDRYHLTVEEVVQISDWDRVNQDWLRVYAEQSPQLLGPDTDSEFADCVREVAGRNCRALLVNPGSLRLLAPLAAARTDVVTNSTAMTAYLLQWAGEHAQKKLRVRSDLTDATLPLETAGTFHYNRRIGYHLVVSEYSDLTPVVPLAELQRPLLPGGIVVIDSRNLPGSLDHPDNLVEIRDLRVDGVLFKAFAKK